MAHRKTFKSPNQVRARKGGLPNREGLIGGPRRGLITTDRASRRSLLPFVEGSDDFLGADGTFKPAPSGVTSWGTIIGTLAHQTDLQAALDAKQNLLVFDDTLKAYVLDAS